jgi:hypothetical protein
MFVLLSNPSNGILVHHVRAEMCNAVQGAQHAKDARHAALWVEKHITPENIPLQILNICHAHLGDACCCQSLPAATKIPPNKCIIQQKAYTDHTLPHMLHIIKPARTPTGLSQSHLC